MNPQREPVLSYRSFGVTFRGGQREVEAVRDLDLDLYAGETLTLVGESGSGKTVTALAALGLLAPTAHVSGSVVLNGHDLVTASGRQLRELRRSVVSMVFQEPMSALNPLMRVGEQIMEAVDRSLPKAAARALVIDLLDQVGIPNPAKKVDSYPHEMSGGQRQRAVIAMALAAKPSVIVADEPTTALDVTVQAEILELLRELQEQHGMAILMVTHNMGVVADLADRVAVMYRGDLVETGTSHDVLLTPQHEYTKRLLAAVPALPRLATGASVSVATETGQPKDRPEPILSLSQVCIDYGEGRSRFRAVEYVDLALGPGDFVGLVGESGSGKSTVGRCALGLIKAAEGQVRIFGKDPAQIGRKDELAMRRRIGVVLQDPVASLNPRMKVGDCIAEPMVVHGSHAGTARSARIKELLDAVHLPRDAALRYPHELSGGQRQRVSLARAIALDPELLLADEPTSALDVLVQAQVLNVLAELQERYAFACLFVSHDLAVVDSLTRDVVVMRRGSIVEQGRTEQVLRDPQDPYTRSLLSAAPVPNPIEQAERRTAWLATQRLSI